MFDNIINRITTSSLEKDAKKEVNSLIKDVNPNAFYVGIVVDTNDFYKLGRVKVRVPCIHGGIPEQRNFLPDSALPWAKPAVMSGAGNDLGQFIVPSKGTRVIVSFEMDDLSRPLYFGGIPTLHMQDKNYNDNPNTFGGAPVIIKDDDRIKDLKENTSQQVVYKSFKGATIIIDDQDGYENLKIIDQAGQVFEMGHIGTTLERRGANILEDLEEPNYENYIRVSNGTSYIEMIGDTIKIKGNIEYVE